MIGSDVLFGGRPFLVRFQSLTDGASGGAPMVLEFVVPADGDDSAEPAFTKTIRWQNKSDKHIPIDRAISDCCLTVHNWAYANGYLSD